MKLTVGDDFKPVYDLIFRVKRNHPQYVQNHKKIFQNVDRYITLYRDNLQKYQRTNRERYRDRAQENLDAITELLTAVERSEILSYLTGGNNVK